MRKYSELDSSGSVKKLVKGVSLKLNSGKTELYILFNKLFLLNLIKYMNSFSLLFPFFRVSNGMM